MSFDAGCSLMCLRGALKGTLSRSGPTSYSTHRQEQRRICIADLVSGNRVFVLFVLLSTTGFDSSGWGGRSGAGGAGAGEVVVLLEEGLSGSAGLGCVFVDCQF